MEMLSPIVQPNDQNKQGNKQNEKIFLQFQISFKWMLLVSGYLLLEKIANIFGFVQQMKWEILKNLWWFEQF